MIVYYKKWLMTLEIYCKEQLTLFTKCIEKVEKNTKIKHEMSSYLN